jgi:hypothetical protein
MHLLTEIGIWALGFLVGYALALLETLRRVRRRDDEEI